MARPTVTRTVRLPAERAYAAWIESFEEMPRRFPDRFLEAKILSREGNELDTSCAEVWGGRTMRYKMHMTLTPGKRVDEVVVEGDGKGTRATWSFEPAPGGAKVSVTLQPGGIEAMFGALFRKRFEAELAQVIDLWISVVEPPSA
jgi:ribosome-associated toxin RatA of RatAB toxin-antitoxin module